MQRRANPKSPILYFPEYETSTFSDTQSSLTWLDIQMHYESVMQTFQS